MGDIRDQLTVREAMKGCEMVFHLAALIAIPYSYVAPSSYIDTNIKGTLNVVQAARDLRHLQSYTYFNFRNLWLGTIRTNY